MSEEYPLLKIKLQGDLIDKIGVNIYHLGRFFQSSQELMNASASHTIKSDIPLEKYATQTYLPEHYYRRLFVQGHLAKVREGSLDVLIQMVAQPELRSFMLSDDFRAFGISVIANLFTSIGLILFERRTKNQNDRPRDKEQSLAIHLVPHLEKLTRCITPRGGIERIELKAEETECNSTLHLIVDRGSRDKVLDFAESVAPQNISIAGEIRSVDLDHRTAVIVDAITGERYELRENNEIGFNRNLLGQRVYIQGKLSSVVKRNGNIGSKVEIASIKPLEKIINE